MTRLGWGIAIGLLLLVLAFASMTRLGPAMRQSAPARNVAPIAGASGEIDTGLLTIPVAGVRREAIVDTWGDPRGGGARGHRGTDIPASRGTPVVAVAPGRIEKLFQSNLGGITVYLRSPDRRWIYYYAHLAGYVGGLHEGQAVSAGQSIGYVGDTGDAGAGNFHLHFGMQRMRPDEQWYQGKDVNPFPMLAARATSR